MNNRTTFVIAHRLSTIRRADQILVVERGRIVELGSHQSLLDLGGRYYELYTKQHGIERNLFLPPEELNDSEAMIADKTKISATELLAEHPVPGTNAEALALRRPYVETA